MIKSKVFILLILVSSLFSNDLDEFEDEFDVKMESVGNKSNNGLLSKYNVLMTDFNDVTYEYFLHPVSKVYKNSIDEDIRYGVSNVYSNVYFPQRFINNLLQLKFENSWIEIQRFLINSTLGFFGFKDVAKIVFNLEPKNEDFGQTLGYYNVPRGYHIVLPFLGPSNLRDIRGLTFDGVTSVNYYMDTKTLISTQLLKTVNSTSLNLDFYHTIKKDSLVLQPYLENMYESYREKLIKE